MKKQNATEQHKMAEGWMQVTFFLSWAMFALGIFSNQPNVRGIVWMAGVMFGMMSLHFNQHRTYWGLKQTIRK